MFNGKMKAVTFSYDDGVRQDRRLVEIFNKYGLKATFNINSELLGKEGFVRLGADSCLIEHHKIAPEEVKTLYAGHEVAVHTLTHPLLPKIEDDNEIIRQVEQDRINLSELCGYEVIGMAYPCGGQNHDDRVADIIRKNTGVKYCRNISSSYSFDIQNDLYKFKPTMHHIVDIDKTMEFGRKFIEFETDVPQIFYIWGHAYELDYNDRWGEFEEFCKLISGHDDIFYGTNKEILLDK